MVEDDNVGVLPLSNRTAEVVADVDPILIVPTIFWVPALLYDTAWVVGLTPAANVNGNSVLAVCNTLAADKVL